jgi:hypothetical protein
MTTATEMIDCMLDAYLLALGGVDQCPESVPSELKFRLLANVERAEKAFSDAAADGLIRDCSHLVPVVRRLFAANRLVCELERATCLAVEIAGDLEIPFQSSESTI